MNSLSTGKSQKRLIFRWATLKGLTAVLLFVIVAALMEYVVVLYARYLGIEDTMMLQWTSQFPGIDRVVTISISPLFHLVPTAVVIALVSSWSYLTKNVAVRPKRERKGQPATKQGTEPGSKDSKRLISKIRRLFSRIKAELLRIRGVAYFWSKIHFARATIKSALTVLLLFGVFTILFSLLSYPQLIYWTVSNTYRNNPSLLSSINSVGNFATGVAEALEPAGWFCLVLNDRLLSLAPGFRAFVLSLGGLIKPLVELDGVGKYLFFQNIAAWISALASLIYGEYRGRSYRYRRRR